MAKNAYVMQSYSNHYNSRELQSRWAVSRQTIHNFVKRGWLNPIYLSTRAKRFPADEVLRFEEERRLRPTAITGGSR